jgi:hypothetical protein
MLRIFIQQLKYVKFKLFKSLPSTNVTGTDH